MVKEHSPESITRQLSSLLDNGELDTLFQPVVNLLSQETQGYNVLVTGVPGSPFSNPELLYNTAEQTQQLALFTETMLQTILSRAYTLHIDELLFIEIPALAVAQHFVSASTLRLAVEALGMPASRFVIQVKDDRPLINASTLREQLIAFKSLDFKTAVANIGAGFKSAEFWLECQPDFCKLPRHLVDDIHNDPLKQELLFEITDKSNKRTRFIAPGNGALPQIETLFRAGIHLYQGSEFGSYRSIPAKGRLPSINSTSTYTEPERLTCQSLAYYVKPLQPETKLKEVAERFATGDSASCLPVVGNNKPLGIAHKWRILELFSTQYGRALFENKPIVDFISSDTIIVDEHTPLLDLSRMLTGAEDHYVRQNFLISREHYYLGMGRTRDLLKLITDTKIDAAKYANPLSGLPGNVPINKQIQLLCKKSTPCWIAYFDLDNFKPFNDVFGYSKGDDAIIMLATILSEQLSDLGFVGHVGGDDFIATFSENISPEPICRYIIEQFIQRSRPLYPDTIREQGYFEARDRYGNWRCHPLVNLSIGIIHVRNPDQIGHHQIAELAAAAKKSAKESQRHLVIVSTDDNTSVVPYTLARKRIQHPEPEKCQD
ncbi:signal protein [Oleiphilus messinensis]|uniref:Signal protein n=1 Tax=Oleiphilus messinensis TaxID=141451 RepID=A0A1Y0I6U1_9GAMM|nr:EAL domain-containing protein [Oleiphilus messinensis]ARU55144.1 signal protein [Oleiphilus messinensis]